MEVNIDKLRAVANTLLSHIESHSGKAVTLSEDYYWNVPAAIRYDPYEKPKEHTLGQLSDDMAELTRMINGERPIIGYGLVWLAAILRRRMLIVLLAGRMVRECRSRVTLRLQCGL